MRIRKDSRSIALLAIFTAMVVALEVFPIVGITDLKIPGVFMNIDWTGIPIIIVFFGLGLVYSLISIATMFVAIGYRNFTGAVFKTCAELLTVIGVMVAERALAKRQVSKLVTLLICAAVASVFRAVGMYFTNIGLLPVFYSMTAEASVLASTLMVPWNIVQAIINVVLGGFLYFAIPPRLAAEAGFGKGADEQVLQELPPEAVSKDPRTGS